MIFFMTSTPNIVGGEALNDKNMFTDNLRQYWKENSRCLMIVSSPADYLGNDAMTDYFRRATINSGFTLSCFDVWDNRRAPLTVEELKSYDTIFFAGGHVPTQHNWFEQIKLRELMREYDGILITISAGSMNCAELVYAWPELPGETSPYYQPFFPGLGLANVKILPHFQQTQHNSVDGRNCLEIAKSQSYGHRFFGIPDTSYVIIEKDREVVYGEAYEITNGMMCKFCDDGYWRVIL